MEEERAAGVERRQEEEEGGREGRESREGGKGGLSQKAAGNPPLSIQSEGRRGRACAGRGGSGERKMRVGEREEGTVAVKALPRFSLSLQEVGLKSREH